MMPVDKTLMHSHSNINCYFCVVFVYLLLYKMVLTFEPVKKTWVIPSCGAVKTLIRISKGHSLVPILWRYPKIQLYCLHWIMVVHTFEPTDEILTCEHLNESYKPTRSSDNAYCIIQDTCFSNIWTWGWNHYVWPFKWKPRTIRRPSPDECHRNSKYPCWEVIISMPACLKSFALRQVI